MYRLKSDDLYELAVYQGFPDVQSPQFQTSFSTTSNYLEWVDIDRDRDLDVSTRETLYLNNEGTFTEFAGAWMPNDAGIISWPDVDQDGWPDLLLDSPEGITLHRNEAGVINPTPIWQTPPSLSQSIWIRSSVDDIDGDGDLDVTFLREAVGLGSREILVFENDRLQLGETPLLRKEVGQMRAFDWADVDSDGALELVIGESGFIRLYEVVNGNLLDVPSWESLNLLEPEELTFIDIDQDGDMDLVSSIWFPEAGGVSIYLNNKGTLSQNPAWQDTGFGVTSHDVSDLNQDGLLDLAATPLLVKY